MQKDRVQEECCLPYVYLRPLAGRNVRAAKCNPQNYLTKA
jgi:hypothetical protein